jgi:hypothetical protein
MCIDTAHSRQHQTNGDRTFTQKVPSVYNNSIILKKIKDISYLDQTLTNRRIWGTDLQGDQKVYVSLMITIQKVTGNVQSVPRQSPDIY